MTIINKLAILIFCCPVMVFAGELSQDELSQKKAIYDAYEPMVAPALFAVSLSIAQIQYMMGVGTYKLEKPLNPFDPSFAKCMQNAIANKHYQSALDDTLALYVKDDKANLSQDLAFLSSQKIEQEKQVLGDLFALFAQNTTLVQNHAIFYPRLKRLSHHADDTAPSDTLLSLMSVESDSPFGQFVQRQISECHNVQQLS